MARVPQGRQADGLAQETDRHLQQLAPKAVAGGGPEHRRQQGVGPRRRQQQRFPVGIGVKNAPGVGDDLPCQQSQGQHAARQGTGQ